MDYLELLACAVCHKCLELLYFYLMSSLVPLVVCRDGVWEPWGGDNLSAEIWGGMNNSEQAVPGKSAGLNKCSYRHHRCSISAAQ